MTVEEQRTMQAIQNINRKIPEVTLRDLFAISIIQTQVKDCLYDDNEIKAMAEQTYKIADAMIEARGGKLEGLNALFITRRTLKLKEKFLQEIKELSTMRHCNEICSLCPLYMFDNDTPCAENAKRLLILLGYDKETE